MCRRLSSCDIRRKGTLVDKPMNQQSEIEMRMNFDVTIVRCRNGTAIANRRSVERVIALVASTMHEALSAISRYLPITFISMDIKPFNTQSDMNSKHIQSDIVPTFINKYVCLFPLGFVLTRVYMPEMLNSSPATDKKIPVIAKPTFVLFDKEYVIILQAGGSPVLQNLFLFQCTS